MKCLCIRDVTRSREIRCVSWDPTGLSRTWRYPCKIFCSVYIRAAPLIVKNCDLASNTHAIFFLNHNDSAMSIATVSHGQYQWIVRSMFCRCPCWWIRGSAIIILPMWTLSFTDMGGHWCLWCETGVKDILHSCCCWSRKSNTVFSTRHHYFCVTDI